MRIGRVAGRREHVDDGAAPGELAAVLDELLAAVAELREPGDELVGIDDVGRADGDRLDRRRRRGRGAAAAPARPVTITAGHRSGSRRRHSSSRRWPIVSTDGLTRSNGSVSHAGNTATWPARQELGEVVAELGGHRAGRAGHDERPPARQRGEGGDGDRPGHLDDGQAGVGLAEGAGQRRLVAQQRGEVGQSHGRSRLPSDSRTCPLAVSASQPATFLGRWTLAETGAAAAGRRSP